MPEAEDVILHAAEHVTASVRALWLRHRPPGAAPGVQLMAVHRRLSVLMQACLGQTWPLLPSDPRPRPNWLAARLRNVPPWDRLPQAEAFTDGEHIFLPRCLQVFGDDARDHSLLRLMALTLGVRLRCGAVLHCPAQPMARDLFWAVEGTLAEDVLIAELPGLAAHIAAARWLALTSRPALTRLHPRERVVEQVVRHLLELPPGRVEEVFPTFPTAPALPAAVARWTEALATTSPFDGAGPYRGLAPVPHWGRPRPELSRLAPSRAWPSHLARRASLPSRAQRLANRVETREPTAEDEDGRQGPFAVPYGDPQHSVEAPAGLRRPLDRGADLDLDTLAEEFSRLDQASRVQTDTQVQEILEVEGLRQRRSMLQPMRGIEDGERIAYPEWDYRAAVYRPSYCVLREAAAPMGDPAWSMQRLQEHRGLMRDIRRRFEALRPKRERYTRQLDGDAIDVDAYVDDFAVRRAGRTPTDRLYVADRPRRRDVSVAFLIDASGSTDAWVSAGRRILDLEKEAALVLCEALEALGDRYAVYAFSGRGAPEVWVWRVKGFTEAYGEGVRGRIAGLHGEIFTRLGGPIRHLTALLARQRSRRRLLFLLSDGKPNDEDEYDGVYGIEDTRQAAAEARLQGIDLFCLTVDRQGSIYLPRMFGPYGYTVLWEIIQLPQRLPEIYRLLTTGSG